MKKEYNRIMRKMENRVHRNYYTDSIQAAQYYEYTYNDSTKQLLRAVYMELFPVPAWDADRSYYEKKYHFNRRVYRSHYLMARLYAVNPGTRYGNTFPTGKDALYIGIKELDHDELYLAVKNNKDRRIAIENRNKEDISGPNLSVAYTADKTISSSGKRFRHYYVTDTMFNGEPCYKLRVEGYGNSTYGEKERRKFEQDLVTGYKDYTQEEKDELKYYVEYWANGAYSSTLDYIINKKDYALLHVCYYVKHRNSAEQWLDTKRYMSYYEKGSGNKYRQIYYAEYQLNFVRGMIFHNDRHLATWTVQKPLNRPYLLSEAKKYPKNHNLAYEDFCEMIPVPDDEMLEEWNKKGENR